jgi:hypothetical protein
VTTDPVLSKPAPSTKSVIDSILQIEEEIRKLLADAIETVEQNVNGKVGKSGVCHQ